MKNTGELPVVIVGGGLTGIAAAMYLRRPYVLFERGSRLGGLAQTDRRDGFFFDKTGHWLHLRDPQIIDLVGGLLGDRLVEVERQARIFSHGRTTLYPFQANLSGLPAEVVYECLLGFVNTLQQRSSHEPRNFEDYIDHHFGEGIAKHFMIPYNHKLWGVHPREITSAWCQRFVPIPSVEQVLAGAVGAGPAKMGYNVRFRYPRTGGIETMTRALAGQLDSTRVHLNAAIEAIDPRTRTVQVAGEQQAYHAVVSSMPLPELVRCLRGAPDDVLAAGQRLRATGVRYLNVALKTPPGVDYHWVYAPEAHLPFYRVGVFSNAMPTNAPDQCASFYVELAAREGDAEAVTRDALQGMVSIGAIRDLSDVVFAEMHEIDPAYVVFDEHYESSLKTIHTYLESHGIYSRGRYGEWIYNAMEDSLLAGKQTAERINLEDDSKAKTR